MADQIHVRSIATSVGDFEFRESAGGDGLTISGWVARFGEPVEIEDWAGHYVEEIKRGAFAKTLAERGPSKVKMQFSHGHDSMFGTLPVGVWTTLEEKRQGLWGEGRMLDTWHTVPIRAAIEAGALDGMSVKFRVISENWRKATKAGELDYRQVTEIALFEAGMVVHPAYEGTSVGLRSRALDLYRSEFGGHVVTVASDVATLSETREAVAPVGDTDPAIRTEADPPAGITRREMRIRALTSLGVIPSDPDRGAA